MRERIGNVLASTAIALQAAIVSVVSKEGGSYFQTVIRELTDGN